MSLELELWAMNSARISALEAGGGGGATNAVLYTEQELTDAQKEQARNNIGAIAGGKSEELEITTNHTVRRANKLIIGDLCVLDFDIELTSNISGWTTIATFEDIPKPPANCYPPVILNTTVGFMFLTTEGNVSVASNMSSGQRIFGSISYIIDNGGNT